MRSHKSLRPVGVAMALSVAFAWATVAQASVIAFENLPGPGHFDWTSTAGQEYLSVLSDAASQPGTALEQGTFWRRNDGSGTTVRGRNGSVQRKFLTSAAGPTAQMLATVDEGVEIPTISPDVDGFFAVGIVLLSSPQPEWPDSLIPEGVPSYIGVSFDLGSGLQYGWIGIVRTGAEVDAFAWGYETEPGVSIAAGAGIPEPGTISLLLIGAVGVLGRRRR